MLFSSRLFWTWNMSLLNFEFRLRLIELRWWWGQSFFYVLRGGFKDIAIAISWLADVYERRFFYKNFSSMDSLIFKSIKIQKIVKRKKKIKEVRAIE